MISLFHVRIAGGDASGVGVVVEAERPFLTCLLAGAGGALGVGVVLVAVLRDLLIELEADAVGHAGDDITAGFVGPFRFLDEAGAGFVEAVGGGVFQVVVFEPVALAGDAAEAVNVVVVVAVADIVVLVGILNIDTVVSIPIFFSSPISCLPYQSALDQMESIWDGEVVFHHGSHPVNAQSSWRPLLGALSDTP